MSDKENRETQETAKQLRSEISEKMEKLEKLENKEKSPKTKALLRNGLIINIIVAVCSLIVLSVQNNAASLSVEITFMVTGIISVVSAIFNVTIMIIKKDKQISFGLALAIVIVNLPAFILALTCLIILAY